MIPFSNVSLYRAYGEPAAATVTIESVPAAGVTVTIDSIVFTMGTDFSGRDVRRVAAALAKAINSPAGTDFTGVKRRFFAELRGYRVFLLATAPGTSGNSITLASSNTSAIAISGSTFSGGSSLSVDIEATFGETTAVSIGQVTFGTSFVALPSTTAKRFDLLNNLEIDVQLQRVGSSTPFTLPAGTSKVFSCLANANEWEIKRASGSGSVSLTFEAVA